MALKIISITLAGNSGQPAMALALNDALSENVHCRVLRISKLSLIRRICISFFLGIRLLAGRHKYIVHLGLEAMFARCFFPLRGKVVFINHGIYEYANKRSILRHLAVIFESIGNLLNDIYYVNNSHMKSCGSRLFFQNRANVDNLIFRARTLNESSIVGFVGSLYGAKNCSILKLAVNSFKFITFKHLNLNSEIDYFGSKNYQHLSSDKRIEFFDGIDILLIPSTYESYGLVAYEAVYSGIYVIHSGRDALADFPYQSTVVKGNQSSDWVRAIGMVLSMKTSTSNVYSDDIFAMNKNAKKIICHFKD